ncbi:MAG TPA: GNAT family N-acetyltransferase [Chitinophagales bacterium]|nr:GNAT family N-acetyltransferase [Chitinophagales bacterium]
MINYLNRNEIDENKWNACVQHAGCKLPYAFTWYLDCVSDQWDALVYNDYDAVFPLTWRNRFFIPYLYQPMFTQQLGVFSPSALDENVLKLLLDAIPLRFRFIEINLNYLNRVKHAGFEISPRINLFLDLSADYDQLYHNYHENAKRNLHKAVKRQLHIRSDFSPGIITEFFKSHTGIKIPEIGEYHYEHLHELMEEALQRNAGKVHGVFDERDNLFAAGFFIVTDSRIINLLPSIDEEGKEIGAGFYLVDYLVRHYAGSGRVLDFEGSMIPTIARFYKSFGAQEQTYWHLRRNDLPRLIRWIKG